MKYYGNYHLYNLSQNRSHGKKLPWFQQLLFIFIIKIVGRNSVNTHYFDTKSLIWSQIFFENLSMSIAMNIGRIEFL